MTHVSLRETVSAPAAAIWEIVGDLSRGARWPAVESCEIEGAGVGCVRTLRLVDGSVLRERIEAHDDEARSYRSVMLAPGRVPVKDLSYVVTVRASGSDRSTVDWEVDFEPRGVSEERARSMVEGIYRSSTSSILEELRRASR